MLSTGETILNRPATNGTLTLRRLDFEIALARANTIKTSEVAILDSAVVSFTSKWSDGFDPPYSNGAEACCTLTAEIPGEIQVLQLVIEYKEADQAMRRMIYGLVAAQRQREAVGIFDQVVYGVALVNSRASIWVAWLGEPKFLNGRRVSKPYHATLLGLTIYIADSIHKTNRGS